MCSIGFFLHTPLACTYCAFACAFVRLWEGSRFPVGLWNGDGVSILFDDKFPVIYARDSAGVRDPCTERAYDQHKQAPTHHSTKNPSSNRCCIMFLIIMPKVCSGSIVLRHYERRDIKHHIDDINGCIYPLKEYNRNVNCNVVESDNETL
jgi:hypothetical protein